MTLEVTFHPGAVTELREDVSWYEKRGPGLGERFEASIDSVIDGVLEWADSGTMWPSWESIPVVRSRRVPDIPYRDSPLDLRDRPHHATFHPITSAARSSELNTCSAPPSRRPSGAI